MAPNDYLPGSLRAREEESLDPSFDSVAAGRNAPAPKVRKNAASYKKAPAIDIDPFLLAHYMHLTMGDMADELGMPDHTIRDRCKKLGIKPISVKEQVRQYLLQHGSRKTLKQLVRVLNLGEHHIKDLCNEYSVVPLTEEEATRKHWISPREVFSKASFKLWQ